MNNAKFQCSTQYILAKMVVAVSVFTLSLPCPVLLDSGPTDFVYLLHDAHKFTMFSLDSLCQRACVRACVCARELVG